MQMSLAGMDQDAEGVGEEPKDDYEAMEKGALVKLLRQRDATIRELRLQDKGHGEKGSDKGCGSKGKNKDKGGRGGGKEGKDKDKGGGKEALDPEEWDVVGNKGVAKGCGFPKGKCKEKGCSEKAAALVRVCGEKGKEKGCGEKGKVKDKGCSKGKSYIDKEAGDDGKNGGKGSGEKGNDADKGCGGAECFSMVGIPGKECPMA